MNPNRYRCMNTLTKSMENGILDRLDFVCQIDFRAARVIQIKKGFTVIF